MALVTRHFAAPRPAVTPDQRFVLGDGPAGVVGTLTATGAAATGAAATNDEVPGNWQVVGGSGAGRFAVDPATGTVTIARPHELDLAGEHRFTLEIVVDNRRLTSAAATVTIEVPDRVNVCHRDRTVAVPRRAVRGHLGHGDAIGRCD